jgi:hypothetical protein
MYSALLLVTSVEQVLLRACHHAVRTPLRDEGIEFGRKLHGSRQSRQSPPKQTAATLGTQGRIAEWQPNVQHKVLTLPCGNSVRKAFSA